MTEKWKEIEGYGGNYLVSSLGRVKSLYRKEHFLKPSPDNWGYLCIVLSFEDKPLSFKVHTLVALAFLGARPEGKQVNHKNGIKTDNRAENLEWCTPAENTQHKFRTGLHAVKLKSSDMERVNELCSQGYSQKAIGVMYGVSQSRISYALKNKPTKYAN